MFRMTGGWAAKKKILTIKRNVIPKAAFSQLRELTELKLGILLQSAEILHDVQDDRGWAVKKKVLTIKRNVIPKAALSQLRELTKLKLEILFQRAKLLHGVQDDRGLGG